MPESDGTATFIALGIRHFARNGFDFRPHFWLYSAMTQDLELFACTAHAGSRLTKWRLPLLTFTLATISLSAAVGAEDALKPWATNVEPSDVKQSHTEVVTSANQEYKVVQRGTMDGRNCRLPQGCGMAREGALIQKWESNRSVRMENTGDTDVINPWLSNGRNNFRSAKEIVASAITPGMTDAEKAKALWFQEIVYRHHTLGDGAEVGDPVKVFNVYGYNTCGNDSISLATLWQVAGLKAAPVRAMTHCISQTFYDNGWHFLDGDQHAIYLMRDNETVAAELDISRDHDLIKRTHSQGILLPDDTTTADRQSSWYFCDKPVSGQRGHDAGTTMNMVLRPGEALVWRWGQVEPLKYHGRDRLNYPGPVYNGLWEYRPDFSKETWRKGVTSAENITSGPDGLAAADGKTGTIVWTMRSPYPFVGGRIDIEGTGAECFHTFDGKAWTPVTNNMDPCFPKDGPAQYHYRLKCQLQGAARLRHLAVANDLQMAPLALPEMVVGANTFTYSDQTPGERHVSITHHWVERSTSKPPSAPESAVYPSDGGQVAGTDIAFQWKPGNEPAGDYQFELSERPDMRWPLSMDFYKLVSRTADSGKARYTLRQPGLLTPDRKYYWHVRQMNEQGVWGDWSKTWSFTAHGPAYPLNLTLAYDSAKDEGTLRWQANSVGNRPVKYRVYASDEMGFTISDTKYRLPGGSLPELDSLEKVSTTRNRPASWFPANFIGETTSTEMQVLGCGVASPAANKTYYRVVAVDDRGKRSGPSDYVTSPRPVIYSKPVETAKVGAEYRYQARVTRSYGELITRMNGGHEAEGYFEIEKPAYKLEQAPAWLKIDAATGLLSGTPDAPGKVAVAVTAVDSRQVQDLDEKAWIWGQEKVLSTATKQSDPATQKFTIVVE